MTLPPASGYRRVLNDVVQHCRRLRAEASNREHHSQRVLDVGLRPRRRVPLPAACFAGQADRSFQDFTVIADAVMLPKADGAS
jgi:hypothetical protein